MDIYSLRLPANLRKIIDYQAKKQGIVPSLFIRQQLELALQIDPYHELSEKIQSLQRTSKFLSVATLQALFLIHKMLADPLPVSDSQKQQWLSEALTKAHAEIEKNLDT